MSQKVSTSYFVANVFVVPSSLHFSPVVHHSVIWPQLDLRGRVCAHFYDNIRWIYLSGVLGCRGVGFFYFGCLILAYFITTLCCTGINVKLKLTLFGKSTLANTLLLLSKLLHKLIQLSSKVDYTPKFIS